MPYLFISHTDGLYNCSKKVHIEEDEEKKIRRILEQANLKAEDVELRDDDLIYYELGGYTYYLNDKSLFGNLNLKIDELLLENKERRKKYDEFHKPAF